MYRIHEQGQLEFEDFALPFNGKLNPRNRWVVLASLVPWDEFECEYAVQFALKSGQGAPALPFRTALGALIIQGTLNITDEETVLQIQETPAMQYFIGKHGFQDTPPFDPSMMVHFRKRIGADMLTRVNERMVHKERERQDTQTPLPAAEENTEGSVKETHSGKLLIDSTCVPEDIRYPTDISLLNGVREETEKILDTVFDRARKKRCEQDLFTTEEGEPLGKKPRTYRQKARKEYLSCAKRTRLGEKQRQKGIRKQLAYIRRNIRHIQELADKEEIEIDHKRWDTCVKIYKQQLQMYTTRSRTVPDRIVSIDKPHVRPIVRGKAGANTEFGMKIEFAKEGKYYFVNRMSYDAYHEGKELPMQIEAYKERYGYYPQSVHVDAAYRTRANRLWCTERGIRLAGRGPGRPKKDVQVTREEKAQIRADEKARIPIEGGLGVAKRRYGLDRLYTKTEQTSTTHVALIVLVMNLARILRDIFCAVQNVLQLRLLEWNTTKNIARHTLKTDVGSLMMLCDTG